MRSTCTSNSSGGTWCAMLAQSLVEVLSASEVSGSPYRRVVHCKIMPLETDVSDLFKTAILYNINNDIIKILNHYLSCPMAWTHWEDRRTPGGQVSYKNGFTDAVTWMKPTAFAPHYVPPITIPTAPEYSPPRDLPYNHRYRILLSR